MTSEAGLDFSLGGGGAVADLAGLLLWIDSQWYAFDSVGLHASYWGIWENPGSSFADNQQYTIRIARPPTPTPAPPTRNRSEPPTQPSGAVHGGTQAPDTMRTGLWSDDETLWVSRNGPGADDAVHAYGLHGGGRIEELEFELDRWNGAPRGLWSDGATIWVSDSGRDRLFAYGLASGEQLEARDLDLDERNTSARGIWSDGATMYVLDSLRDSLFAYDLAGGEHLAEYSLDGSNGNAVGIWSDGVSVWVSDQGVRRLFAYRLPVPDTQEGAHEAAPLVRVRSEELAVAPGSSPRGIWSDGAVMYVADGRDDRIFTYQLPAAIDARLAFLALSDVDIGAFTASRTEYRGVVGEGVATTTVEAAAAQPGATVAVEPADRDGRVSGHQIGLETAAAVSVTVTSPDGSRTRRYVVRFGPSLDCLLGDVGEGFSLVTFEGGRIADLDACARREHVGTLWTLHEGAYVGYVVGAPDVANQPFRDLFPGGVPTATPLIAAGPGVTGPPGGASAGEEQPAEEPVDDPDELAVMEQPAEEEQTTARGHTVIGNTGGLGVWRREGCRTEARIPGVPGWLAGTAITVLEEGAGRCAGWLLAEADGVTSWVDGRYVVEESGPPPALPAASGVIGHTGGLGVALRYDCRSDARVPHLTGWSDGTEVSILQAGSGRCAGWLRVRAEGSASWVNERYVTGLLPPSAATWVVGNTGGLGVSHRASCSDHARISAVGGWPDGTVVTVLWVGTGPCAGWLCVESGGVASWVRKAYLLPLP